MIRKVRVTNYKSIPALTLDLGRVTVLIGANGSGKSNILEAIALAAGASQLKLDSEFLISRGIRVTEARFMQAAFNGNPASDAAIQLAVEGDSEVTFACDLIQDESATFTKFKHKPGGALAQMFLSELG